MKILVTGGTGFLGRNLFNNHSFESHDVAVLVRTPDLAELYRKFIPTEVQLIDLETLTSVKTNFQPDLIIHAATAYGRIDNVAAVIGANISLPMVLLERFHRNLRGIAYLDTYYNKVNYHYPWLLDYSISKGFFHKWLVEKYQTLPKARIFLEHLYGPYDRHDKFIPHAISTLKLGERLRISNGQQVRDFTYVCDVVDGIWRVADWFESNPKLGESQLHTFEFGTGIGTSVADMTRLLASLTNRAIDDLEIGTLPMREKEIMSSIADLKTLTPLAWQPSTTLERGLQFTLTSGNLK